MKVAESQVMKTSNYFFFQDTAPEMRKHDSSSMNFTHYNKCIYWTNPSNWSSQTISLQQLESKIEEQRKVFSPSFKTHIKKMKAWLLESLVKKKKKKKSKPFVNTAISEKSNKINV